MALDLRSNDHATRAWRDWQVSMGVDQDLGETPLSLLSGWRGPVGPARSEKASSVDELARDASPPLFADEPAPAANADRPSGARAIAARCADLDQLRAALEDFDDCALRATATRLCFGVGDPAAEIMLVGEAPGREEDRRGEPFVGPSGALLDRMMRLIGLERDRLWITNLVYWRPPGNRAPTAAEIGQCAPFLERQIALIRPKILVFVGGLAARALLGVKEGVTQLRGRKRTYDAPHGTSVASLVVFHPAYLLRQPQHKRFAWRDMLTLAAMAEELGVSPRVAAQGGVGR